MIGKFTSTIGEFTLKIVTNSIRERDGSTTKREREQLVAPISDPTMFLCKFDTSGEGAPASVRPAFGCVVPILRGNQLRERARRSETIARVPPAYPILNSF